MKPIFSVNFFLNNKKLINTMFSKKHFMTVSKWILKKKKTTEQTKTIKEDNLLFPEGYIYR